MPKVKEEDVQRANEVEVICEILNQVRALVSLSLTAPPFVIGTMVNLTVALLVSYYRGRWTDRIATIQIAPLVFAA